MRRYALPLAVLGIFILFVILLNLKPLEVFSPSELENLETNSIVYIQGTVLKEIKYDKTSILNLENQFQLICDSCPSYLNKKISSISVISRYNSKIQVRVIKISAQSQT